MVPLSLCMCARFCGIFATSSPAIFCQKVCLPLIVKRCSGNEVGDFTFYIQKTDPKSLQRIGVNEIDRNESMGKVTKLKLVNE